MSSESLLHPADYVWLPHVDAGRPEPPPPGAEDIRAVRLGRRVGPDHVARTVLVETATGFLPLPRRIRLHGDADEGWDWGWRGSAPLETALNLLTCFVHPRAAWRLQWAFCEAFLHPLPPAGGTLEGDAVRGWLREHAWIGRRQGRTDSAEVTERATLADDRMRSRALSPIDRAARAARLLGDGLGWNRPAHRRGTRPDAHGEAPADPLARAAAVLAGAPAEQRWATMAMLAAHLPGASTPAHRAWQDAASPCTPGIPGPDTIAAIAGAWSRLVGRPARERAALLTRTIHERAGRGAGRWTAIPDLALPLGGGLAEARRGELHMAGDPVAVAATIHALRAAMRDNPALAASAEALGLTPATLGDLARDAHAFHVDALREERRSMEAEAAVLAERVQEAQALRLSRGRSRPPPPGSSALRRWVLAASEELLVQLVRAVRGPAGPLTVRAALRAAGTVFPDPPGTVGQALAWYLEERAPRVLDLPAFLVRGDGLHHTPAAR